MNKSRRHLHTCALFYGAVFALIATIFVLSLMLGAVKLSLADLTACLSGDHTSSAYKILRFVRLPRAVGACLCGAALASSGAIIQSVLQNPLGSPNVLGMNAGAGFAVILCAAFLPAIPGMVPLSAFLGAFLTLLLVCALGHKAGGSRATVLLSGVAANTFFAALSDAVVVLIPDTVYSRTAFKIGSLSGLQLTTLTPAAIIILVALGAAFALRHELDILALGDESAASLGLAVRQVRFAALVVAALLCGAAISFSGLVGFVGLMVPHCARFFVGAEMKKLLPASAASGALLVLASDLLSRLLFAPYELPVGIVLSLTGGCFFVLLLLKERRGAHD